MRVLVCCLALILVAVCVVDGISFQESHVPGPVFAWSGASHFSGKAVEVGDFVDSNDVSTMFLDLVGAKSNGRLSGVVRDGAELPEIVVVLVKSQLTTPRFSQLASAYAVDSDGGRFSSIKSAMESSASSVAIPYVGSASDSTLWTALTKQGLTGLTTRWPKARSVVSGVPSVASMPGSPRLVRKTDDLLAFLDDNQDLFTNGVPDVITVYLGKGEDSLDDEDSLVSNLQESISSSTDNWAMLYGSDLSAVHSAVHRYVDTESDLRLNLADMVRATNGTNSEIAGTFFPKQVWEGLVVSIVILAGVLIGSYCTCYLQVPPKLFDREALRARKNR